MANVCQPLGTRSLRRKMRVFEAAHTCVAPTAQGEAISILWMLSYHAITARVAIGKMEKHFGY
jgi:hypothetical protein